MHDTGVEKQSGEIKFYINAGTDTYRFASLFQEECEKLHVNYYYKVVDARKEDEYKRNDKMCIYTKQSDAEKILEIVEQLIRKHPEINFKNPPILTGVIGKYIGVGMDNNETSYNKIMSKICYNTLEENFRGIPRENIMNFIKEHPEKLQQLKNAIMANISHTHLSKLFDDNNISTQMSATSTFNNLSRQQLEAILRQTQVQNQNKRNELDNLLRKQSLIAQIISAQQEGKELDEKLRIAKENKTL